MFGSNPQRLKLRIMEVGINLKIIEIMTPNERYKKLFTESKTIPTELCENVTWVDLAVKAALSSLRPGKYYRITDYNTVVVADNAEVMSAGHQFDVIVLALTESTLSDDAFAAVHSGDTYFANSLLERWKLKYSFNGIWDYKDFLAESYNGEDIAFTINLKNGQPIEGPTCNGMTTDTTTGEKFFSFSKDQVNYWVPFTEDLSSATWMYTITGVEENKSKVEITGVSYEINQSGQAVAHSKGVIYDMIDEWGNEAPYDFKNIMVSGSILNTIMSTVMSSQISIPPYDDDAWYYTFSYIQQNSPLEDALISDASASEDFFINAKIIETSNFSPDISGSYPSVFFITHQTEIYSDVTITNCQGVIVIGPYCTSVRAYGNAFVVLSELTNCEVNNCYESLLRACSNSKFNRVRNTRLNDVQDPIGFSGYRFEDIIPSSNVSFNSNSLDAEYKGEAGTGWIASYNKYTGNALTIYRHNVKQQTIGDTPYPYTGVFLDPEEDSWVPIYPQIS